MASSTITVPVTQFAKQVKLKYPQYSSVPDEKLVAAFVAKNSWCKANYQDTTLVSVSYEPAAAAAPAQKPGVTASVQSPTASAATNHAGQATVVRTTPTPIPSPASSPLTHDVSSAVAVMDPPKATVVRPVVSASTSASEGEAESAQVPGAPAPQAPYLGSTVIVNTATVPAPPMVGKYEIVDELGRGGMGLVYKAFDPGIGRTVALKVMSEQLARDTDFRERFVREARGAGILQHPNIVTVHELGEWQGAPFIAMEFLEGRSLEDILKNEKTTPLEKRLDIVTQVCRGLDYAHARGIVHRDIKPANVMVTSEGFAKVVDFGIARLADQKLTRVGHVMGTVSYMSPEQLQGKVLDGRSDIFAVGVMLFESLTSVLPFSADDTGSAITNTLYRQPPKLSSFLANYPKELDEIIGKCLAKDPAERFQTAGELADRLTQVQQELQRSQTAPTVIRSTPLPSSAASEPLGAPRVVSPAVASQQLQQVASQSADMAKEWWKVASPRARRNVVTMVCAAALYIVAIQLVAVPVAILAAIVLAAQLPFVRNWWKTASMQGQLAVGVPVTAVAAFSCTKLATGVMWYLGFSDNRLMAVPVLGVVATIIGANGGLALDWWKSASGKARVVGAIVNVLLIVCFAVSAMNWSSTPKSYFARGGEFEQKENARAAALAPDTSSPMLETLHILSGHSREVVSVAFSPDGMTLASGDKGGTLKLWDSGSGQALQTIETHYSIDSLRFSPDGRSLIAATDPPPQYSESEIKAQPNVRIWDVSTGQQQRDLEGRSFLAFNENGTLVAIPTSGSRTMFNIWDVNNWMKVRTIDAQGGDLSSLSIGHEGRKTLVAAASSRSDQITVWDTETGENHSTFKAQLGTFNRTFVLLIESSVVVARNRDMSIFSTLGDQRNHVWTDCEVSSLSQTAGMLAVGCGDGQVKFWRISDVKQMRPLQAHTLQINAVTTNPRTGWIATASDDKTVKLWKQK